MPMLKYKDNRTSFFLFPLLLIAAILIIVIAFIYIKYFGVTISSDHTKWAEFGSIIGGLITPLLSFFSLIAVLFIFVGENNHKRRDNDNRNIKFYIDELDMSLKLMTIEARKYLKMNELNTHDEVFAEYFRISMNFIKGSKTSKKESKFEQIIANYQIFTNFTLIIINAIDLYISVFEYISETQNKDFYLRFFMNRISMKSLDAIYICTDDTKELDKYLKATNYGGIVEDLIKLRTEINEVIKMTENAKRLWKNKKINNNQM